MAKNNIDKDDIYLFKVADYTTELLGRFDSIEKCYYIQRGDGVKYKYAEYRITWKQKLNYSQHDDITESLCNCKCAKYPGTSVLHFMSI